MNDSWRHWHPLTQTSSDAMLIYSSQDFAMHFNLFSSFCCCCFCCCSEDASAFHFVCKWEKKRKSIFSCPSRVFCKLVKGSLWNWPKVFDKMKLCRALRKCYFVSLFHHDKKYGKELGPRISEIWKREVRIQK